jgi:hypothetical protein
MTPQDWHALRRYLRERKAIDWPDYLHRAAARHEINQIQNRMRQILSRRRRQRKQVA